jgi:hypothetical protein
MKKLSKTKEKVITLLQQHPHLRDSDERLVATFWMNEAGGKEELERMTSLEFFMKYVEGVYTSSDSITRMRRKVQEDNESLRGQTYYKRQKLEKEFREEIKHV